MSNTCTCRQPQFSIPRSAFSYDEKAAYTDYVLKIWTEGRFGPGCEYEPFVQMSDRTEVDVAAFHQMLEMRMQFFQAVDSLGRKTLGTTPSIFEDAEQTPFLTTDSSPINPAAALPPNLGRGSP